MNNEISQVEKTATVLIRKIRDAILDDIFKPGDWLPELDLAKRFEVSRSPIREALHPTAGNERSPKSYIYVVAAF